VIIVLCPRETGAFCVRQSKNCSDDLTERQQAASTRKNRRIAPPPPVTCLLLCIRVVTDVLDDASCAFCNAPTHAVDTMTLNEHSCLLITFWSVFHRKMNAGVVCIKCSLWCFCIDRISDKRALAATANTCWDDSSECPQTARLYIYR